MTLPIIDYTILNGDNTPLDLRKPINTDWENYLSTGVTIDNDWVEQYYLDTTYIIEHNAQILSLEHYLNNIPGKPSSFYIYITDYIKIYNHPYIFKESEIVYTEDETYIFEEGESISSTDEIYLFELSEIGADDYDFVVNISYFDMADSDFYTKVQNAVNYYRPAGKKAKYVGF